MVKPNQLARIGALVGDPTRAVMLATLMDGRALSAGELAAAANITRQTASSHLGKMVEAKLLVVERQGKHRYHRLASPEIAAMLEGMMQIAAAESLISKRPVTGPRDAEMRHARTCYDHFAGKLGIAITDALIERGAVVFDSDSGHVTESGVETLRDLGLDPARLSASKRPACRPCLDWSERRPHIAGQLGAMICVHFLRSGYVRRVAKSRTVKVSPKGTVFMRDALGIRDPI